MNLGERRVVRPTRRTLNDLTIAVPVLDEPLHELDDPVVNAAQSVPERRAAGAAERVRSLADRVWFKVKTSTSRAVVTVLNDDERPDHLGGDLGAWWIGAAGSRQDDSPQRDFYASIERESTIGKTVSTSHLLPQYWDWRRLSGEGAVAWKRQMRRLVVHLAALSLKSGEMAVAEFADHRIKVLVRAEHGHEAYISIIAEGIPNPAVIAFVFACIPGVNPDDWMPEPSQVVGMTLESGEVAWSTILPTEAATQILDIDSEH